MKIKAEFTQSNYKLFKIINMNYTQFDAKTGAFFTVNVEGCSYDQHIVGPGFFVIVEPNSKHVSFSKQHHNICFGDVVSDIIPEYTNQQYANDYGDKLIGDGQTVREYMRINCRMDIK